MIVFLCIALGIIAGGMGYCLLRCPLMVISVKSGNFTVSRTLFQIKTIFLIVAILCLTISGILSITQRDEIGTTDRIYILDISESMLTEDMGDLSRLEYAKRLILRDLSPNIASWLVVYAGEYLFISPPTLDQRSMATTLANITPRTLQKKWSKMVDTLLGILTATSNESRRELIVLSDGDLGQSDLTDLSSLLLSRPGVSISTVGIGSELGGRIPIGKDLFGKSLFKKKWNVEILTRLESKNLKEVAQIGRGTYFNGTIPTRDSPIQILSDVPKNISVLFAYLGAISLLVGFFIPVRFLWKR